MELPSVVLNRKWGMSKCGYRREAEIEMYESTAGGLEPNNRSKEWRVDLSFRKCLSSQCISQPAAIKQGSIKMKGAGVSSQDSVRN